jgi:hypothetical protein
MQFSKVLSACIGISQANLRVLVIVIGCRRFICHPQLVDLTGGTDLPRSPSISSGAQVDTCACLPAGPAATIH